MKPRRLARARRHDALYRTIQRNRLERIAGGEIAPLCPHEFYFLWTVQAGRRARYADFILPRLMFRAAYDEATDAAAESEAGAPAPAPAHAALTAS